MKHQHSKTPCVDNPETSSNKVISHEFADSAPYKLEAVDSGIGEIAAFDDTRAAMLPLARNTNTQNKTNKIRKQQSAHSVISRKLLNEPKVGKIKVRPTSFTLRSGRLNSKRRRPNTLLEADRGSESSACFHSPVDKAFKKSCDSAKCSRMCKARTSQEGETNKNTENKHSCIVSGFSTDDMHEEDKSALAKFYTDGKTTVSESPSCNESAFHLKRLSKEQIGFPKMFIMPNSTDDKCFTNKPPRSPLVNRPTKNRNTTIFIDPKDMHLETKQYSVANDNDLNKDNTKSISNLRKTVQSLHIPSDRRCTLSSTQIEPKQGKCKSLTKSSEEDIVTQRVFSSTQSQRDMGDLHKFRCRSIGRDQARDLKSHENVLRRSRNVRSPSRQNGVSRLQYCFNPVISYPGRDLCNRCCCSIYPCSEGNSQSNRKVRVPYDVGFFTRNQKCFLDGRLSNYEGFTSQMPIQTVPKEHFQDSGYQPFDNSMKSPENPYYQYEFQGSGDMGHPYRLATTSSSGAESRSIYKSKAGKESTVEVNTDSLHYSNSGSISVLRNRPMNFFQFWNSELAYFNNRGTFDGIHLSPFRSQVSAFNKPRLSELEGSNSVTDNLTTNQEDELFSSDQTDPDTNTTSIATYQSARSLESRPLRRPQRIHRPRPQRTRTTRNNRKRFPFAKTDWPEQGSTYLPFDVMKAVRPVMLFSAVVWLLMLFRAAFLKT